MPSRSPPPKPPASIEDIVAELRGIRELLIAQQRLTQYAFAARGFGLRPHRQISGSTFLIPKIVYRNDVADRWIGVVVEVTTASAVAGATISVVSDAEGKPYCAPLPADVAGASSPVIMLSPGASLRLQLSDADAVAMIYVADAEPVIRR